LVTVTFTVAVSVVEISLGVITKPPTENAADGAGWVVVATGVVVVAAGLVVVVSGVVVVMTGNVVIGTGAVVVVVCTGTNAGTP
jgi:hypothetical protein